MKTPLTKEMQAIILTVQDYARFLRHYHMSVLGNKKYDWWNEAQKFYVSLKDKLPEGMNTCNACFESVMRYRIEETTSTEFDKLPDIFSFSY